MKKIVQTSQSVTSCDFYLEELLPIINLHQNYKILLFTECVIQSLSISHIINSHELGKRLCINNLKSSSKIIF